MTTTGPKSPGLRVAFAGASHWHAAFYYDALAVDPNVAIVGIHDSDGAAAVEIGRSLRCNSYSEVGEMLEQSRPELVFVFGTHREMPRLASAMVDAGVPFVIEKPAGLDQAGVADLARRVVQRDLYCDVPLTYRMSPWVAHLRQHTSDPGRAAVCHAHFRLISGPPDRYITLGSSWNLDPAESGGGCTMNLSVHFLDLFSYLVGEQVAVRSASVSSKAFGLPVEDYSVVGLESASGAIATVETGYTFPQYGPLDFSIALRTTTHYYSVIPDQVLITEVSSGDTICLRGPTINAQFYPQFARDAVARQSSRKPPVATLDDMALTLGLVESAYELAR